MATVPHSTGSMLALYLDEQTAAQLALPGGQDPADLHVTVAYTGKAAGVDPWRLRHAAEAVLDRKPITATISGHARFTGNEDGDVIVALVDSPELEQLRRAVVDALADQGITLPAEHGYTAHCTLAYVDPGAASPIERLDPIPLTFNTLTVEHGDDRDDLPFALAEASLPVLLRLAYAQGWAASGGPLTERVRAGCTAVVELAMANADQPGVLEATLHLGHLEGVWAAVYERREKLHADNEAKILKAWKALGVRLHTDLIVKAARKLAGLTETAPDPNGEWLNSLTLRLIAHDAAGSDITDTIRAATLASEVEGRAAGAALLAAERGQTGFDFDIAATDAYKALASAPNLIGASEVDAWLTRTLGDAANEVGSKLATLTAAGASYEDMTAAVGGILDGTSARSVQTAIDLLTSRALSQGSLDLYRSEGVTHVEFLTAGDGRVCVRCSDLEAKNPYRIGNAPLSGQHPWCRCAVSPVLDPQAVVASPAPVSGDLAATELTLADHIASGVANSVILGGGSQAETELVTFNDGTQAVKKAAKTGAERDPKESTDAEYLAGRLGQEAGIRVPEAVRTADNTVYMGYVPKAQTGMEWFADLGYDQRALNPLADSVEGRRLGLFDLVTGNTDRNDGNWLVDSAGRLHGIDHGMAFQVWRSPAELADFVTGRNLFAGRLLQLDSETYKVIGGTRAFTRADIDHFRAALERLEGEFTTLKRRSWYRQTMARLNWLAKYAEGEGSLFG